MLFHIGSVGCAAHCVIVILEATNMVYSILHA